MKKSVITLILILMGLGAYYYLERSPGTVISVPVIDSSTPLQCSQCDKKSLNPPPCLNCRLQKKIKLESGEEVEGKILKITGDKVTVQIQYGTMTINKSQVILDLIEEEQSVSAVPQNEQSQTEETARPEEKKSNIQPEKEIKSKPEIQLPIASKVAPKDIKNIFSKQTWIAYNPSEYSPGCEKTLSSESVIKDLELLKSCGFDGIVTYSSVNKMAEIPLLAKQHGFNSVVMGIWDPNNQEEFDNAVRAKDFADAYCLGNEGLHFKRYSQDVLINQLRLLKKATGRAVTTSEPLDIVMGNKFYEIMRECDFLFLIAHFFFDKELKSNDPRVGAQWVLAMHRDVKARVCMNKPLIMKEIGFPTAGENWADEKKQETFLKSMETNKILWCYFEAFDQPWKNDVPVEPYWGLFNKNRTPKQYVKNRMNK